MEQVVMGQCQSGLAVETCCIEPTACLERFGEPPHHGYRHVKALTERLLADALAALQAGTPTPSASTLTQQHALIRSADEYGDLFAHAATAGSTSLHTTEITQP